MFEFLLNPVSATLCILAFGSAVTLLLPLWVTAENRVELSFSTTILSLFLALSALVFLRQSEVQIIGFSLDSSSFFISLSVLISALISGFLAGKALQSEGVDYPVEFSFLILTATVGALVVSCADNSVVLFLGVEILSLSAYALTGAARHSKLSTEAALRYFLLGCFASAILLYGFALLYGVTGSLSLEQISLNSKFLNPELIGPVSFILVLCALLFKLGVVPFHFWVPDVYQGAPSPATAFMACVVKAATFVALLRLVTITYAPFLSSVFWLLWLLSILSMTVGNLVALRQRSFKRLLAYSSIAHTGYMLAAVAVIASTANQELRSSAQSGLLFYIFTYCIMSLGAFSVVTLRASTTSNTDSIGSWNGLAKQKPYVAACLALFLLALAGLPPGVVGLVSKALLITPILSAGLTGLAVFVLINSAISCFYYLRVLVAVYFIPSDSESELFPDVSPAIGGVIVACAVVLMVVGFFPGLVLALV